MGAGSAGCVLANRLTEDPSIRVLLLEAGPDDTLETIQVPALFSALFGTEVDWNYQIEQQANYHGSTTFPRGKTLGGSSSINLMVYIRGHRADFDGWSERGNVGWDYDSVLPYFIKAEHNSRLGAPFHGTDGPLHVEDRLFTHELSHAWVDAAAEWGLTRNDDFNGARQIGAGAYQVTCRNGRRWSGADGYLRPAMQRPNLVVRVGAHVTRVLIDGNRATGVSYVQHGTETIAHAASEVLLSGGVINSPQLLLLSGIGPADQVRAHGIDVVADVPGVGENLHDHTMVPLVWATQHSTDLLEMASPENMELWQGGHGGPFASNGGEVGGFVSTAGERRAECPIDRRANRIRRPRPHQSAAAELHHADRIDAPAQPRPVVAEVDRPAGPSTHRPGLLRSPRRPRRYHGRTARLTGDRQPKPDLQIPSRPERSDGG